MEQNLTWKSFQSLLRLCFFAGYFLSFLGCQYKLGYQPLKSGEKTYSSVTLAYVDGDEQGFFQDVLARSFAKASSLRFQRDDAELDLQVDLTVAKLKDIGFVYKRRPSDLERTNKLQANEGRQALSVKYRILDLETGKEVIPETFLKVDLDFDFEDDEASFEALSTTAGRLESRKEARESIMEPLFRRLAEKMVQSIESQI